MFNNYFNIIWIFRELNNIWHITIGAINQSYKHQSYKFIYKPFLLNVTILDKITKIEITSQTIICINM